MLVDLHIHTDASDGTWRPEVLMHRIKERGLGLFAVADHDSIGNIEKVQCLVKKEKGLEFIRGVEISTSFNDNFFHILCYGLDINNSEITKLLAYNIQIFNDFQRKIVKHFSLSVDDFNAYRNDHSRGGMKVLNFMLDKGFCKDLGHYIKLVHKDNRFTPPPYLGIEKIVSTIKGAGGVPILAHPGSTLTSVGLSFDEIEEIIELGVEGLECYSQYHDEKKTKEFVKFCKKRSLLITGGSDCHGDLIATRRLGYPEVKLSQLNLGNLLLSQT